MPKANRTRKITVTARMNAEEYADFKNKVAVSGLSQQAFIINAVRDATITPSDEMALLKEINNTFTEYVKQIRGMGTNLNQMAHVANGQGFLPGEDILLNLSDQVITMRKEGEDVWQLIRSSISQQRAMGQ